jgi:hypothetical protein
MISKQAVEEQLKRIGCNFRFWGRSEINELGRILMEDEIIAQAVNGEYTNGFAMLVSTNHRLLLVDKKPFLYLTVEDVRYEMITEFNYNHRLMNATINIFTANKTLTFTSWNMHRLRKLMEYSQARVLEMRQQQHMASQFTAAAAAQYAQMSAAQAQMQYVPRDMQPESVSYRQEPRISQPPTPELAERATPEPLPAAPSPAQLPPAPRHPGIASRFASGRAALGTYTRSKLPSFRRHHDASDRHVESGEVLPQGYDPNAAMRDFKMPYEYEG